MNPNVLLHPTSPSDLVSSFRFELESDLAAFSSYVKMMQRRSCKFLMSV